MQNSRIILVPLLFISISAFAQIFEKVENIAPVTTNTASRGVIFIDLNQDNFPDLYVVNGPQNGQNNELYFNNKNGGFDPVNAGVTRDNSATVGATFGDANNDGYVDGYLANWYNESNLYYTGKEGGFEREVVVGIGSRGHSESAAWGDFDNDGFLDLFVANSSFGNGEKNVLVQHLGNGAYVQLQIPATEGIVNSRSVNWIDANGDGQLDLFVGNEQAGNELYLNVDGALVKEEENVFLTSNESTFGSSWDDVDNDGDLDLILANFGSANWLSINDGNAVFSTMRLGSGSGNSIGSTMGDFDNDGDLDLYITNGFPQAGEMANNELLINDGKGAFSATTDDPSVTSTISSYGTAVADYDNDGFLDLFVANTHGAPNNLYRNLGNDNNWIKINCEGRLSNFSSIGASLKIKAKIDGENVWQMRHITSQSGYTSQNDLKAHFGLKNAEIIDSLIITWPSGNRLIKKNIEVNQTLTFTEPVFSGQLRANFAVSTIEFEDEFKLTLRNLSAFNEEDDVSFTWDFDGDGEIDAKEFEPIVNYPEEGTYEIKLSAKSGEAIKEFSRKILVKVGLTLGVRDSVEVTVFPNPTAATLSIKSPYQIEQLQMLDLEGKEVKRISNPSGEVSLSGLVPGNYVLRFQIGSTVVIRRIEIEKR